MEENKEVVVEGQEEVAPSEQQEVKEVYTKEEVDAMMKKYQSDSEKGVQKLI